MSEIRDGSLATQSGGAKSSAATPGFGLSATGNETMHLYRRPPVPGNDRFNRRSTQAMGTAMNGAKVSAKLILRVCLDLLEHMRGQPMAA